VLRHGVNAHKTLDVRAQNSGPTRGAAAEIWAATLQMVGETIQAVAT
jgi:hypothetical protein